MDYADALQACAECFARCAYMYRGKIDNAAWFMSVFKIAVVNEFNTLSIADMTQRALMQEEVNEYLTNRETERRAKLKQPRRENNYSKDCYTKTVDFNDGPLQIALKQASNELHVVLNVISNAPAEMLGMLLTNDGVADEVWSRRICRLCGIKKQRNVIGELRELLSP
jgi:hypothetical protein